MTDYFQAARDRLAEARNAADQAIKRNVTSLMTATGRIVQAAAGSQPAQMAAALLLDTPSAQPRPAQAPINHPLIEQRKRQMDKEMGDYMAAAAVTNNPEDAETAWPVAFGRWINRVRPHGEWDDKNLPGTGGADQERQGNYAYAATAHHLGLPEEIALRGAGAAQRLSNLMNALTGRPLTPSQGQPYDPVGAFGDDWRDGRDIKDAYRDERGS